METLYSDGEQPTLSELLAAEKRERVSVINVEESLEDLQAPNL